MSGQSVLQVDVQGRGRPAPGPRPPWAWLSQWLSCPVWCAACAAAARVRRSPLRTCTRKWLAPRRPWSLTFARRGGRRSCSRRPQPAPGPTGAAHRGPGALPRPALRHRALLQRPASGPCPAQAGPRRATDHLPDGRRQPRVGLRHLHGRPRHGRRRRGRTQRHADPGCRDAGGRQGPGVLSAGRILICLDHTATTPIGPEVVQAMEPFLTAQP